MVGRINVTKQKDLEVVLHNIFPGANILKNVRSKAHIKLPSSSFLELDFWIPELKLSFEFQDPYHYEDVWYVNAPLERIKKKDEFKKQAVADRGETLVAVPCWWDGEPDSLIATIRQQRPELFKNISLSLPPIDKEPPEGFFKALDFSIPEIGKLMIATFFVPGQHDPINWWINEKYDGTRVCWHAKQRTLFSRNAGKVSLLPSMLSLFPREIVEGELWFGRSTFTESQHLFSKTGEIIPNWESLRFLVFDSPSPSLQSLPFEERIAAVLEGVEDEHPLMIPTSCVKCKSKLHMGWITREVIRNGGEGIVMRRPESIYAHGRSDAFLKLKAARDQDALVLSANDRVCVLQLPNGQKIKAKVIAPNIHPSVHDIVSISFKREQEGVPVMARIFQIRTDVKWEDVIRNHSAGGIDALDREAAVPKTLTQGGSVRYPHGYWTDNEAANLRKFYTTFAQNRNFDPLVLDNWLKTPRNEIIAEAGTSNIFTKVGSMSKSLAQAFPEAAGKFARNFKNYWAELEHRRNFFDNYAKQNGFDPLIPENWYPISRNTLEKSAKGVSIIKHSQGGLALALQQAYPNIHFDASRFHNKFYWHEKEKVKIFFEHFAASRGFDPRDPEAWYRETKQSLFNAKGGATILSIYGTFTKALNDIFPDVEFDEKKFQSKVEKSRWEEKSNSKAFFDKFANTHGFDPLDAKQWRSVNTEMVQKEKNGGSLLRFYNGSLAEALINTYPDVDFKESEFLIAQKIHWKEEKNRKLFFDNFAKTRNFDALIPENWYNIKKADLISEKGHWFVLSYYEGDYIRAIMTLYPSIGFKEKDFAKSEKKWNTPEKRREFFDTIASILNFDPLVPENWYSCQIKSENLSSVLFYHHNSVIEALIELYPEVNFDESQFSFKRRNFWTQEKKRDFLLSFAKQHAFDPYDVSNWHKVTATAIIAAKGKSVLGTKSLPKVLIEIFPELPWQRNT